MWQFKNTLFIAGFKNIVKTIILTPEDLLEMAFMKYVARIVKMHFNHNVGHFNIEDNIFI